MPRKRATGTSKECKRPQFKDTAAAIEHGTQGHVRLSEEQRAHGTILIIGAIHLRQLRKRISDVRVRLGVNVTPITGKRKAKRMRIQRKKSRGRRMSYRHGVV